MDVFLQLVKLLLQLHSSHNIKQKHNFSCNGQRTLNEILKMHRNIQKLVHFIKPGAAFTIF